MSWKRDIQLRDLADEQPVEITCRRCGWTQYQRASALHGFGKMSYLDEMEKRLTCRQRGCNGPVRIALVDKTVTDGFVGGMP